MSFIITVMYILLTLIIMSYNQNNSNKIYANLYRHQPPITMPTFTILTPTCDKTLKRTFWCSASKHSTVKKENTNARQSHRVPRAPEITTRIVHHTILTYFVISTYFVMTSRPFIIINKTLTTKVLHISFKPLPNFMKFNSSK